MNFISSITPDSIANTIRMNKTYNHYVIVEGDKDQKFYSKIFNKTVKVIIGDNKEKVIKATEILNSRGSESNSYFSIVDKDFDDYFKTAKTLNVFNTDYHSLEGYCFFSEAFNEFTNEFVNINNLKKLNLESIEELRERIIDICIPLTKLRILSIEDKLNLKFKPKNDKEQEFVYSKFICKKKFEYLGDEKLIGVVCTYYNQALGKNKELLSGLHKIKIEEESYKFLVHGHDIINVLNVALSKLYRNEVNVKTQNDLEKILRLSYNSQYFKKSKLKQELDLISNNLF